MHTNETGREPTEPTDAGPLLERFERWWAEEGVGTSPNYGQDSDECNRRLAEVAWLNGAYVARELDGQRPIPGSEVSRAEVLRMSTDTLLKAEAERLPDTPAPDEVAPKLGEQCMHGQLKPLCLACDLEIEVTRITRDNSNLRTANTALTARVAGLEAALRMFLEAGLGNSTDVVQQRAAVFNAAKLLTAPTHTAPGGEGGGNG